MVDAIRGMAEGPFIPALNYRMSAREYLQHLAATGVLPLFYADALNCKGMYLSCAPPSSPFAAHVIDALAVDVSLG